MSQVDRPTPLFIDTGAFFARFNRRAFEHEEATAVFEGIRSGGLPYGPLFTSRAVLSELATLMHRKVGHPPAVEALDSIRSAESINILSVESDDFDRACTQFETYDDQEISFVDHTSGVLADRLEIDHVFTFDVTDFRTLGFVVVPADSGDV